VAQRLSAPCTDARISSRRLAHLRASVELHRQRRAYRVALARIAAQYAPTRKAAR
jgi:hypothetical protein